MLIPHVCVELERPCTHTATPVDAELYGIACHKTQYDCIQSAAFDTHIIQTDSEFIGATDSPTIPISLV